MELIRGRKTPLKNAIVISDDMGVIKVNRIGIRRVVSDACHDLISDEKLAEEEM